MLRSIASRFLASRSIAPGRCRRLAAGAAVAVVALGPATSLAACGDDDDDAVAPPPSGAAETTEPVATPTTSGGGPGGDDLVAASGGAPAATGAGLDEPPGSADRVRFGEFGEVAIAITAPDGTVTGWCVLLAATDTQRQRGLMEVTDLQGFAGMLFVWDQDVESSFYMRNTPTPLSIAWVAADGRLVSTEDMTPCEDVDGCPLYSPAGPYRFALEVPQGELDDMGVVPGSTLTAGGACAPADSS